MKNNKKNFFLTFPVMPFDINQFFFEFFIRPMIDSSVQGYNLVNTMIYGLILLGLAFYVIYPQLNKRGFKFNETFALSLISYIIIGTTLRAINAFNLLPGIIEKTSSPFELGFYTFTPGVWFLIFFLVVIGIYLGKNVIKKNFTKTFVAFGLIIALPLLLFLFINYTNWEGFLITLIAILIVSFGIKFGLTHGLKNKLLENKLNFLAFQGQVIDGVASVIAINFFNFGEQHPLSNALIGLNPILFVIVKVILILAILYFVEKEIEDENLKNFTKTFLFVLGFATGIASLLKIGLV